MGFYIFELLTKCSNTLKLWWEML